MSPKREQRTSFSERAVAACAQLWARVPPGSPGSYLLALALVAVAAIVRFAFSWTGEAENILVFPTFFAAIALASMIGGFRPGALAATASFAIAWYWFYPPTGHWAFRQRVDIVNAMLFLTSALIVASGGGLFRQVAKDLLDARDALTKSHAETAKALAESVHRTRNVLAVVQALARHTAREEGAPARFTAAFGARLEALGRAQDALLTSPNMVDLAEVAQRALAPFVDLPGFALHPGPAIALRPETALPLTLALHELATNAIKYGGLSAEGGGVALTWALEPNGLASIDWTETARVAPHETDGSGSPLIRSAIGSEAESAVRLDFAPDGVRCRMTFRPRAA